MSRCRHTLVLGPSIYPWTRRSIVTRFVKAENLEHGGNPEQRETLGVRVDIW